MQRSASLDAIFNCLQFNLTEYLNKIVRKFKNLKESVIYFHLKWNLCLNCKSEKEY